MLTSSSQAIALAIPGFFALIAFEWVMSLRKRRDVYRLNDSIADLGCGIGQQTLQIFTTLWIAAAYTLVYDRFSIWKLDPSRWSTWVIAMVGVDLAYYWWHRLSHRVNALWAVHVVHHQSQEYNLSVALRQAMFSNFTSFPFYGMLALVGVPPQVTLISIALNTLYQFWIHTRLVGKLGPLEWVFNTASHHRVHHGVNPKYIDKNYGGISIIWDRLFRSFEEEREEPVYGTVRAFKSWNPLWANIEPFAHLWNESRQARNLKDGLLLWVMPPEWRGTGLKHHEIPVPDKRAKKWDPPYARALQPYLLIQFAALATGLTTLMWNPDVIPAPLRAGLCACILLSVASWGGLLERKAWAIRLEWARLAGAATGLALTLGRIATGTAVPASPVTLGLLLAFSLMSLLWFGRVAPALSGRGRP
ncbi:MAG: sterol desaturase family protein [Bdellovibrionales bacterium]|nr:sterol desaturase family protein [Bdellovibrionales bacterium]